MQFAPATTKPPIRAIVFSLGLTLALFIVTVVRALRGHVMDWFWWTLLLMIATSTVNRLRIRRMWRIPLLVLFALSGAATVTGLVLAVIHDRGA